MFHTLVEDETLYCVCLDGRPIERALTKQQAERQADYLARGFVKHRAYDNRRTGELTIRPDHDATAQHDRRYKQFKSHTTVSV